MESFQLVGSILAVVSTEAAKEKIIAGSPPVFIVRDEAEQQKIALYLSKTLDAMAHDLENGILLIIRH